MKIGGYPRGCIVVFCCRPRLTTIIKEIWEIEISGVGTRAGGTPLYPHPQTIGLGTVPLS